MAKREFEIGEKIQLGNSSLIVEETHKYECNICFFYNLCRTECYKEVTDMIGECTNIKREDGKNVVFVKVDD